MGSIDIRATEPTVLNNISRFKQSLSEHPSRSLRISAQREYTVLLNRETGDMYFSNQIEEGGENFGKWKEFTLRVNEDRSGVHFEVEKIKPSELASKAWTIASETIRILNLKGANIHSKEGELLAEERVLAQMRSDQIERARIEKLPGWAGSLDRIEAEKKLEEAPIGSYLIRDGDPITLSLAFHLEEGNHIPLSCYLLTVLEKGEKISDLLLLQTNRGWTLYRDNPDLEDSKDYLFYPTVEALIRSVSDRAKTPLKDL